jgi:hypothetical protein
MLRQSVEDTAYLQKKWHWLKDQHPEQWVAIQGKRVRAYADTHDALLRKLASIGIDPSWTTVELISDGPRRLMS